MHKDQERDAEATGEGGRVCIRHSAGGEGWHSLGDHRAGGKHPDTSTKNTFPKIVNIKI